MGALDRASYQGNNTAYANGSKSGKGYMQLTEIVNNYPNKTVCSSSGSMGISGYDLRCSGTATNTNRQLETQAKYTNLTGTANLEVKLLD